MNDIKDEQNDIVIDEDNSSINNDEQETINNDEQSDNAKEEHKQKVRDGLVKAALQRVTTKEGKVSPILLKEEDKWLQEIIDADYVQPVKEDTDFDKMYQERRDTEKYDEALELLVDELDEKEVQSIDNQVNELRQKHPTMSVMEAFGLVTKPIVISDTVRRKTRLRNQQIIPSGSPVGNNSDQKEYESYVAGMKSLGLTYSREKFKRHKEAGIL